MKLIYWLVMLGILSYAKFWLVITSDPINHAEMWFWAVASVICSGLILRWIHRYGNRV